MSAGGARAQRPGREPSIAADARELYQQLERGAVSALGQTPADQGGEGAARARRRELYTLLAVCADQVIADFIVDVPAEAIGAIGAGSGSPDEWASAAFCDLLLETFGRYFERNADRWRDGLQPSRIAPLLDRIDEIGPSTSGVLDVARFHYAESLLSSGMRSIAPVAPPVLGAIIDLANAAGLSTAPETIEQIALRSGGILSRLAAVGLDGTRELEHQLIDPATMEFKPESRARLGGTPGQEQLEITLPVIGRVPGSDRWPLPASYEYVIGCPTLVRLDTRVPLQRLWSWTVSTAEPSGYLAARVNRRAA